MKKNFYVKIIAIILVGLLFATFGYATIKQSIIEKTPTTHIAYALSQSEDAQTINGNFKFSLNEESPMLKNEMKEGTIKYFSEILDKIELTYNSHINIPEDNIVNSKFNYNLGLQYDGSPIVTGDVFYENFLVGMKSNELFQEGVYFDINKEIEEVDLTTIKYQDFYNIIFEEDELMNNLKENYQAYLDIYDNQLGDKFVKTNEKMNIQGKDVRGHLYALDLSYNDQIKLYKSLLNQMENDENLKLLVQDRLLKIVNLAEKDYSYLIKESEEDIEKGFNELKSEITTNFDELWLEGFKEAREEFSDEVISSDLNRTFNGDFTQSIEFFISKDNQLRNISVLVDTPIVSTKQSFSINKYNPTEEIDISNFIYFEDMTSEQENQIQMNALSNVLNSEGIRKFRADSERLNVNEETNMINSYLNMLNNF